MFEFVRSLCPFQEEAFVCCSDGMQKRDFVPCRQLDLSFPKKQRKGCGERDEVVFLCERRFVCN